MSIIQIKGNLKLISSGNVPTVSNLPKGYCAFGTVNNKVSLYGNITGSSIVDLFQDITIEPVQSLGQSTTDIMSQKAVTDALTSLGHLFTLKGFANSKDDLPLTDNKVGYVYIITDPDNPNADAEEYVWTDRNEWERLGVVVATDLSAYYNKTQTDAKIKELRDAMITSQEREKISKIIINGDGSKVLTDDGNYSNVQFVIDEI